MLRHGGDESGADRVDPSGRPVRVLATFEEVKVERTSLSSLEVDSGIRAVQSGDALGHGAEGCRHATILDRVFTGFAGGRAPASVLTVTGSVGKEVVETVGMQDSTEGAGDALLITPGGPVNEDPLFFGSNASSAGCRGDRARKAEVMVEISEGRSWISFQGRGCG